MDRAFLDVAFESSHDAFLDGVPCPREQQAEADQVGEDPRRKEEGTPRKHGHPIHDGLRRNAPIRKVLLQLPQGPEPLLAGQPGTRDPRKDHQADGRPKSDQLAHLNQKRQFHEGNDDKKEGEPPENTHGAIIPPPGGDRSCPPVPSSPAPSPPLDFGTEAHWGHRPGAARAYMEETYFRRGFGLKTQVQPLIHLEYHSALVEEIRSEGNRKVMGDITVRLAQDFGFCYGVDRAIDYAYETRHKFPERRIRLVGEIIHNPHVNQRIRDMGMEFILPGDDGVFDFSELTEQDVVILPAFGVTVQDLAALREIGCVMVDTTCGSVLLVWKRVESYARDGFTAVIHGKHYHEESRATASQVSNHEKGRYIMVRDMEEADLICDYIANRPNRLPRDAFIDHFRSKATEGFDPDLDLRKMGVANQTTMLANESLAIGARLREAMVEGSGEDYAESNFRSFDTICSATQERQDAIEAMMKEGPPEVMIVIGGYNSSNTDHLAHLCRDFTTTYHIEDAACIDLENGTIRHKPDVGSDTPEEMVTDWMPEGPFDLGITAGASTPNNKIGETLLRILEVRGVEHAVRSG